MKAYDKMYRLLTGEPRARERKNKHRAVRALLIRKYPELKEIDPERLQDVIAEAQTYDRVWRKVTQDHEHLRGLDYEDKFHLEEKAKESLGYSTITM